MSGEPVEMSPRPGDVIEGHVVVEGYMKRCGCCWAVRCPTCDYFHQHGAGEGFRDSHCTDRTAPDYYLIDAGQPFTEEMEKLDRKLRAAYRRRVRMERHRQARRARGR